MSVVAAKVYEDKIVMAADSQSTNGYTKFTSSDFNKLERINGMVVGATGLSSESSLMWHYMQTHAPADGTTKSVLEFMVEFADWKKNKTGQYDIENHYLMIFKTHLFYIEGILVREISKYFAIGSGRDYALAALYLGHSPREAAKVAAELNCFVAEPILEEVVRKDG